MDITLKHSREINDKHFEMLNLIIDLLSCWDTEINNRPFQVDVMELNKYLSIMH